jgi:hypothetical protein
MSGILHPFPTTNEKAEPNPRIEGRTDWSSPHGYPDRRKRFPAQETLLGSYINQQYRFQDKEITPSETRTINHFLNGVILTAWNKFGQPTEEQQNLIQNEHLKQHLEERKLKYEPILTLASNFRWLEDSYLVEGLTFHQAEDIATAYGQLAFVILHDNKAVVRLTTNASFMGLPRDTELTTFVTMKEVGYNHCPARYQANDKTKCTMVGGPYGSAAIHAAGIWGTTRKQFVSRLGCTPCNAKPNATVPPKDGAILVSEPDMPSRFGGFQWGSAPYLGV